MPQFARLLAAALLGAAVFGASGAAVASFPGTNGQIVFTSDRTGDDEIFSANPDGSDVQNLTQHADTDQSPAISAGGSRIAFATFRDGRSNIYAMNADGSNQRQVTGQGLDSETSDAQPAWSPSGDRIAFASTRPFNQSWQIWTAKTDGTDLVKLTDTFGVQPAWSPDGSEIVYTSTDPAQPGSSFIYVMNADGTNQHRLTSGGTLPEDSPSWSPDGKEVVFGRYAADWQTTNTHELYVIGADGSGETQLTTGGFFNAHPAFSPDGTKIVFQRQAGLVLDPELYVMDAGGANVTPFVTSPGHNFGPDWGVGAEPAGPRITISSPLAGSQYLVGQGLGADYACEPGASGSQIVSCVGTVGNGEVIDTSTAGTKRFDVTAQDADGRTSSRSSTYIVGYTFEGFLPPVANFPELNVVKAGTQLPITFSLGGDQGTAIFADRSPSSHALRCHTGDELAGGTPAVGTLEYAAPNYTFLWSTSRSWAGTCRQLILVLRDGTVHRANFGFTK